MGKYSWNIHRLPNSQLFLHISTIYKNLYRNPLTGNVSDLLVSFFISKLEIALWRTASLRSAPQAVHIKTSLCCCR
jgi:hypothetical protein